MATFVEITPDAFGSVFKAVGIAGGTNRFTDENDPERASGYHHHVRRPVRGIQIKEDKYATIQVRQSNGKPLPLFDAASSTRTGRGELNSNFLVQSIQEARVEKQQIVMTFGEPYIFFFGEQPRVINVSGVLLNTEDFNWRAEWWENYDKYLRGTSCVRNRSRVYLSWDDIVVEGYLMTSSAQETSQEQNFVRFEFQMFLTNYQNISNIGSSEIRTGQEVDLEANTEFLNSLGQGESSTLRVRETNILAARLAEGQGKNSLLSTLRSGAIADAFSQGTARLMEIQGQVLDILSEAGRFVAGRNIRVPFGFQGSSVFDDAQIALASIPNAEAVITGEERTVSLNRTLAGRSFTVQGALGPKSVPPNMTGHYYDNEDEFIARVTTPREGAISAPELYRDQKAADDQEAMDRAMTAFKAFGVDVEPPDEMNLLLQRVVFGVMSVAVGSVLNRGLKESGTARFATNLL